MREYIDRFYRRFMKPADLVTFTVQIKESDLMMNAQSDLSQLTYSILDRERKNLEAYIRYDPNFKRSLVPVEVADFAPPICKIMAKAAHKANVGPMAAVAGAINDRLAGDLLRVSQELIIENGGDLLIHSLKERVVAIYAGENSPFQSKLGIRIASGKTWGIATSSGKIGPSLSFGQADAVTIVADSSALADAWATSIGNRVKTKDDIEEVLTFCETIHDIIGVVILFQDHLGIRGDIQLVQL